MLRLDQPFRLELVAAIGRGGGRGRSFGDGTLAGVAVDRRARRVDQAGLRRVCSQVGQHGLQAADGAIAVTGRIGDGGAHRGRPRGVEHQLRRAEERRSSSQQAEVDVALDERRLGVASGMMRRVSQADHPPAGTAKAGRDRSADKAACAGDERHARLLLQRLHGRCLRIERGRRQHGVAKPVVQVPRSGYVRRKGGVQHGQSAQGQGEPAAA